MTACDSTITGAECSACGRFFRRVMDCFSHTVEAHGRKAEPLIAWEPRQRDLFALEGE